VFIKRQAVKGKSVEPRISSVDDGCDPESATVQDPIAMVSSNLVLVAVLELLTLNNGACRKAMKLHFKHVPSKVDFAVWVPVDTINLMKRDIPAYRAIFDATKHDELRCDYTLSVSDLTQGRRKENSEGRIEYWFSDFDPAAYGDKWPIPLPISGSDAHALVLGPVSVPMLTAQSDSFVKFLHLLTTTGEKRYSAGDRYDEPSYRAAYNDSYGLMVAERQFVAAQFLIDTYRLFCDAKGLQLVDKLVSRVLHLTSLPPSAPGYLMQFNLSFEPSSDNPDIGKVWGIGGAPKPQVPRCIPSTPQDLELLEMAKQGLISCPTRFLPDGVEPTREAASQLLCGIATNTTPLLHFKPSDDGISAQEHARAMLGLAGPTASGEPVGDGSG